MKPQLVPIAVGIEPATPSKAAPGKTFAILERTAMTNLSRTMPDAQSAVLLCLAWHAALQQRMRHGSLAGRQLARISAPALAKITGRPVRTVRHALRQLKAGGKIEKENDAPGRTSVYRLRLEDGRACEREHYMKQDVDAAKVTPD